MCRTLRPVTSLLHGVPIAELKMSTNLKRLLKSTVQMYYKMLHFAVHCSWYTLSAKQCCGEIEFRQTQTGRLARGRVSEKQPLEVRAGPPLGAKASRSKIQKWSANISNSGAADQCQIDFENICVPHGTPR